MKLFEVLVQEERCRITAIPWEEPILQFIQREEEGGRYPCKYAVKSQRPAITLVLPPATLNRVSTSAGTGRIDTFIFT